MKKNSVLVLAIVCCLQLNAQQKTEILNNKSVTELVKAGLSEDLIVSKIEGTPCKFDVSTTALIDLKKQKVPETVINAMMNKSDETTVSAGTGSSAAAAGKKIAQLDIINLIHYYKGTALAPLEKTSASLKTKSKALGYGGVNVVYEIDGLKSDVRISSSSPMKFAVNTGGGPADGFVLYKLQVKKSSRQAIVTNVSSFSGMKGSQGVMVTNVKSLGNNQYEISPSKPLEPGEYFFALKSSNTSMSTSDAEVYSFGVD